MVEEANGIVRMFGSYLLEVRTSRLSFEEVCSRIEDLLDTLPTLLSDNKGLSKDDLVFSNMGQNEKELNSIYYQGFVSCFVIECECAFLLDSSDLVTILFVILKNAR
ncbi:hypothetical protein Tco_0144125 [Tanacetum coccineum]